MWIWQKYRKKRKNYQIFFRENGSFERSFDQFRYQIDIQFCFFWKDENLIIAEGITLRCVCHTIAAWSKSHVKADIFAHYSKERKGGMKLKGYLFRLVGGFALYLLDQGSIIGIRP